MHIEPSSVPDVELIGPDAPQFPASIALLVGGEPADALQPALPYSVIVKNNGARPLALLGVRFDMVSRRQKPYSVVHYADTLRHPEKTSLVPGAMRFVCAEPRYTCMVLRRERQVDRRSSMNLENLAAALRVAASLDCVACDDGQFSGPDSNGAFDRLQREREAESALIEEVRKAGCGVEALLAQAIEAPDKPARRALAKEFHTALAAGELAARVENHRLRIPLWRGASPKTGELR
jgi:hypothetical protein